MEDVGFVWVKDRWSRITSKLRGVSTNAKITTALQDWEEFYGRQQEFTAAGASVTSMKWSIV